MAFSKLSSSLREKLCPFRLEDEYQEPKTRCIYCRTKDRLLRFRDLHTGSHICMGGKKLMFSIGGRQVAAYSHHAIVKSTQTISNSTAMVTMIHFYTTPYDMSVRIQETTEYLDMYYHEIYIIRYRHPTHPPDIIIERAELLKAQSRQAKYSVFSCNCEHFCNWCCVGIAKSFQAENAKDVLNNVLTGIANVGGKSVSVACRLILLSLEDVSKISSSCLINVPWGVLSAFTILYLLFIVYQNFKLNEERNKGNLCSACTCRKKLDMWIQFVAYCGLQAGGLGLLSLVISTSASHGIVLGSLLVCSVLSLVCISSVPKLRRSFLSPFEGRLHPIKSLRKVWIGDVISFQHWNMSHSSVVSAVKIFPGTYYKKGTFKIIHYSQTGVFSRRRIIEEEKTIDLDFDSVFGHDYSGYKVHEPEVVVNRARQRLGETKFKMTSNRSCHFCHWAKVNEGLNAETDDEDDSYSQTAGLVYWREVNPTETISNLPLHSVHVDHTRGRKSASKVIGKKCARIRDDVEAGQLIEFRLNGFSDKAIITDVHCDVNTPSKFALSLVHNGQDMQLCEEKIKFDLNQDDIWIYKYHPRFRHRKTNIIERARAKVYENKCNTSISKRLFCHLDKDIVEKRDSSHVLDTREIKPGDVIKIRYWSHSHEAVVSDIHVQRCKSVSTGEIDIIHYTTDKIGVPFTIKEETILMDTQKDRISIINYDGYVTYPQDKVIERARSRLGEQRFSILDNTSADFVHWAKVVQSPVIISEPKSPNGSQSGCRLLVPKAGSRVEEFQRFSARTWSELSPGTIVEFRTNLCKTQGIVSYVDEKRNMIKVIKYCTDGIISPKTIREENKKLDILHDDIWIYRGHPKRCYKPDIVLANALRQLGKTKTDYRKSAWDFCKECVLKQI